MRRLTGLIASCMLLDTIFAAALAPLLPRLSSDFGLAKSGSGILTASFTLGTLLACLPAAAIASRFGARPTLLAGLCSMFVGTSAFAFASNVAVLDASRLLQGIASALAWTGGLSWLLGLDAAARGRRMGIANSSALAGAMLGPAVGAGASVFGTRASFGFLAVVAFVLAALAWSAPGAPEASGQSLRDLRRVSVGGREAKGLWLIGLASVFLGVQSVLAPLRMADLGVGPLGIAVAFLAAAGVEATFNPALGRYLDRSRQLGPVRAVLIGAAILAVVLPWVGSGPVLVLVVVATNIGYGVAWVPGMTLVAHGSDDMGLDQALGVALMNIAWAGGYSGGAALGGWVAQASTDAVPYIGIALMCIAVVVMLRDGDSRLLATGPTARMEDQPGDGRSDRRRDEPR